MSGAKQRCALSTLALAVVLLPGPALAQTLQTGSQTGDDTTTSPSGSTTTLPSDMTTTPPYGSTSSPTGSTSALPYGSSTTSPYGSTAASSFGSTAVPSADGTTNPAASNPSQMVGGASNWSAGQGSFGTSGRLTGTMSGSTGRVSGTAGGFTGRASWVAGSGSFGSKAQQGGIWREDSGSSLNSNARTAYKPASGSYGSVASPIPTGLAPTFTNQPAGVLSAYPAAPPATISPAPFSRALYSHGLVGQHGGSSTRPGAAGGTSKGTRSGTAGRARSKSSGLDFRSQSGTQNPGNTGPASGTKSPGTGTTAQRPFVFAPPKSATGTDTSSDGTAPQTPPQ